MMTAGTDGRCEPVHFWSNLICLEALTIRVWDGWNQENSLATITSSFTLIVWRGRILVQVVDRRRLMIVNTNSVDCVEWNACVASKVTRKLQGAQPPQFLIPMKRCHTPQLLTDREILGQLIMSKANGDPRLLHDLLTLCPKQTWSMPRSGRYRITIVLAHLVGRE